MYLGDQLLKDLSDPWGKVHEVNEEPVPDVEEDEEILDVERS